MIDYSEYDHEICECFEIYLDKGKCQIDLINQENRIIKSQFINIKNNSEVIF